MQAYCEREGEGYVPWAPKTQILASKLFGIVPRLPSYPYTHKIQVEYRCTQTKGSTDAKTQANVEVDWEWGGIDMVG